ncbi:MAG: EAL domain-containing protein [Butyrivibrio sp.]|nr:EAL domain-containing protein [Butyrivibrio sp.]
MELLTQPKNYDVCISISALVLMAVIVVIYSSEEYYHGKQSRIFGVLIAVGTLLNVMGLIHHLWINNEEVKNYITYDMNCLIVIVEKILTYLVGFFSIVYLMAIFRITPNKLWKKLLVIVPSVYTILVIMSGTFTDAICRFDYKGEIILAFPYNHTVNIGIIMYLIFASYLIAKYNKVLTSEKMVAISAYYILMLMGIGMRFFTKTGVVFEFGVAISLLLCVFTFQNPSHFVDRMSGVGTKNALNFAVYTNLIQRRMFTLMEIRVDKLSGTIGNEAVEAASSLLKQMADYLKKLCPEAGVFFPRDGFFALLIPDVKSSSDVIDKLADTIKTRFKEPFKLKDLDVTFDISTSAIGYPDDVKTIERFDEISNMMYKALSRESKYVLRVADLNLRYAEYDKKIGNLVRHAVDNGLLEVYYQPIYSPSTGKFSSCEALVRLKDTRAGYISPGVFMPIAERNGTVLGIDKFVLSSVCEMLATTKAVSYGLEYVEVNLSVVDCIQTNLAETILGIMKRYNIGPSRINLEITETWEKDVTSVIEQNISKLMSEGLTFSMDDFGMGYSNFSRLADMPVKIFKLDKSTIQAAFESETSYMIMYNMIKIIKGLGKEIVAEGVETGEQAKQIIRLGCDHIQGFFYARPMPLKQFLEFLQDHNYS